MNLTVKSVADGIADVQIAGSINQAHLSQNQEPLSAALGPNTYEHRILLDLNNTEFIDSSGVNWLLIVHRRMRENGGRLVLHSLPPMVENVLKVLRMNLVFEIAPSRDDARRLVEGDNP